MKKFYKSFGKVSSYVFGVGAVGLEVIDKFMHSVVPVVYLTKENESFEAFHDFVEPILNHPAYNVAIAGLLVGGVYHLFKDRRNKKYVSEIKEKNFVLEEENSLLRKLLGNVKFKLEDRVISESNKKPLGLN